MRVAGSVAGVCVVRDARDLVALTCGHYLRIGFAHVAIVDDGSSDGTYEVVAALSRREPRVSVRRVADPVFRQAELVTRVANELVDRGFAIIVPFDVDEFWDVCAADLERRYSGLHEAVFRGRWVNFVQRRTVVGPGAFSLYGATYRTELEDGDRQAVTSRRRPFVSYVSTKVGCKTTRPVEFKPGQHALGGHKAASDGGAEFEIFHLPLRNRSEIAKRGLDYERRRAPLRPNEEQSWQSRFHRDVVLAGCIDEVWAANSADPRGSLDCHGTPVPLVRDRRLRSTLWRSQAYLVRRRLLPARGAVSDRSRAGVEAESDPAV